MAEKGAGKRKKENMCFFIINDAIFLLFYLFFFPCVKLHTKKITVCIFGIISHLARSNYRTKSEGSLVAHNNDFSYMRHSLGKQYTFCVRETRISFYRCKVKQLVKSL
jgi:hypothetical protein